MFLTLVPAIEKNISLGDLFSVSNVLKNSIDGTGVKSCLLLTKKK